MSDDTDRESITLHLQLTAPELAIALTHERIALKTSILCRNNAMIRAVQWIDKCLNGYDDLTPALKHDISVMRMDLVHVVGEPPKKESDE